DALQGTDSYTTQGTQTFDTKNVGTGKTLTATGASINDGNSGLNYTIHYVTNTTGVINLRDVNVTAQSDTKTYDGNNSSSVSPVGDALQGTDSYTTQGTQTFDTRNVGTGKTLTATGASINDGNSGPNYTIHYVTNTTGKITARSITITADAKTKVYGNADPALTAQVTSGTIVTGDVPSGSLTRVPGENVGSYAINKGTYTYGSNYAEIYVGANLSITQRAITITADAK